MSDEIYAGKDAFEQFRKLVEDGEIRHPPDPLHIHGVPIHKAENVEPDKVYLLDSHAFEFEISRAVQDDFIDAMKMNFVSQARFGLGFRSHNGLIRPSRWRDRFKESWKLYWQSVREGWRGLDPHEPSPQFWRDKSEETLARSVCMIAGHNVEWRTRSYAICRECGSSRSIPDPHTSVLLTGVV